MGPQGYALRIAPTCRDRDLRSSDTRPAWPRNSRDRTPRSCSSRGHRATLDRNRPAARQDGDRALRTVGGGSSRRFGINGVSARLRRDRVAQSRIPPTRSPFVGSF